MIKVSEKYVIKAESYGYVVIKKVGKDSNRVIGHPRSVQHGLSIIIADRQREIVAQNTLTLKQALIEFNKINEELKRLLREIGKDEPVY